MKKQKRLKRKAIENPGQRFLTEEERKLSTKDIRFIIVDIESDVSISKELKIEKLRYYNLLLRFKIAQKKLIIEDMIRKKLNLDKIAGKFYPEDVAKVIGVTPRQARVLEKKAVSKLRTPKIGKPLKELKFDFMEDKRFN